MPNYRFERSVELKRIFNRELETWRRKNGGGLEDLAAMCGVSPAYLAHVKRYGRIPGRPVLILLALQFELQNPDIFFHAAGIEDPFPFAEPVGIQKLQASKDQLFSFSLNTDVLATSIRSAIREELAHSSGTALSAESTIRLGLNTEQTAMFSNTKKGGFFPDFIEMLSTNLRCKIDAVPVARSEYRAKMQEGKIDLYGPILPDFPSQGVFFTKPFCRLGRSALVRKTHTEGLEKLPTPTEIGALQTSPYRIAVIRDSREHIYANITLQKRDQDLVICESIEEAVERLTMTSIPKTAHLFICNSLTALTYQEKHPKLLEVTFAEHDTVISMSDCCLAVRPGWQQRISAFDEAILYLVRNGALTRSAQTHLSEKMREAIEIALPDSRPTGAQLSHTADAMNPKEVIDPLRSNQQ